MSKFKKETSKRIKRANKIFANTEYRWDISDYKRDVNPIEHDCIFLGDDIQKECIWGNTELRFLNRRRTEKNINYFKEPDIEQYMIEKLQYMINWDYVNYNPVAGIITSLIGLDIIGFFYYESKENI